MIKTLFITLCILLNGLSYAENNHKLSAPNLFILDIKGPIGPATSDYIHREFNMIQQQAASLIILRLDTPGGLDISMREIIKDILASPIPIVTFVSPAGARAASAGTYILYASHIAAMTPATNLGAATPVTMMDPSPLAKKEPSTAQDKAPPNMTQKMRNDAAAYIKSLAEMRHRNAQWAEKAVTEAASLSAKAALEHQVIDILADDLADLLSQLQGRTVTIRNQSITLDTTGPIIEIKPDWRSQFLAIITDPNIAYMLMLIGIYGLIFELANPGTIISGVIGAICLLLALFAFQVLPINTAGLALMLFGFALMVGEAFAPSFGALGIGGIISVVVGSIILMDTDIPGFTLSTPLIATFTFVSATLFTVIITLAVRARRRPVVSGEEEFINRWGEVLDDFEQQGIIRFEGELWNANSQQPVKKGQKVRILAVDGLTLLVKPQEDNMS